MNLQMTFIEEGHSEQQLDSKTHIPATAKERCADTVAWGMSGSSNTSHISPFSGRGRPLQNKRWSEEGHHTGHNFWPSHLCGDQGAGGAGELHRPSTTLKYTELYSSQAQVVILFGVLRKCVLETFCLQ